MTDPADLEALALFDAYLKATGVPSLSHVRADDPALQGRTLGILNGSSWISLWSTWFARRLLPGVKLVSAGNEAVQLNFMAAHHRGEPVPRRRTSIRSHAPRSTCSASIPWTRSSSPARP